MGKRITRVYTRSGDDGTTNVGDGGRASKDAPLVQMIGDIDELNAGIGLLRAGGLSSDIDSLLSAIQNDLLSLGGELVSTQFQIVTSAHVEQLEQHIDRFNAALEPLEEFILPAGNHMVAQCHVARTVCRRAERSLITLSKEAPVRDEVKQYINRLSDLLFVLARVIGKQSGADEVYWDKGS